MNKEGIGLWAFILFLVAEFTVMLTLVPGDYIQEVVDEEYTLYKTMFGEQTTNYIHAVASERYHRHLVETNILHHTMSALVADGGDGAYDLKGTGWWFDYVSSRIDSLAAAYYHFQARWACLEMFLPYFLLLLLPSLWDGILEWMIKRTNYNYSSPAIHSYASRGVTFITIGLLALFLAPIVLQPIVIGVAVLSIAVLIGLFIGNAQKRI